MATLNIVLWSRVRADKTQTIAFRLTIARKSKFEMTSYHVRPDQFRSGLSDWVTKHPDAKLINRNLELRRQEIMRNLMDAEAGMLPMTHAAIFTGNATSGLTIGALLTAKADGHEKNRAKISWRRSLLFKKELIECWGSDLPLTAITLQRVEQYVSWLKTPHSAGPGRPVKPNGSNTIKKKLSRLAGVIDQQKDQGLYAGANAFKLVKVAAVRPRKVKLTWEDIGALEGLDLDVSGGPKSMTAIARDMFLFSFYAHGMRFGDCLTFRMSAAKKAVAKSGAATKAAGIDYRMNKNSAPILVENTPPLERVMAKYLGAGDSGLDTGRLYLFPLLTREYVDKWDLHDDKGTWNAEINAYLKRVAILAGINKVITFHIARHTFAQLMKEHQASKGQSNIYIIQQALGHADVRTTQIYLDSLEDEAVNKEVEEMFRGR